ncbi:MAG: family 10 glycosylhydrolase [Lachnospiraceae bacterium]|nr:family 10 glycosylhydrolase [Lachnospiraceae bacterium]
MEKRACWISYLDFELYLKDLNEAEFREQVSSMYDIILEHQLNTVIVHVRAFGDAIYPSDYYPYATYLYSDRNSRGYDALKIMIDMAHERGIYFEAWINPYRISKDDASTASYLQTKQYKSILPYTIMYQTANGETAMALDPKSEKTQALIVNGVRELLDNYAVDGIHFDDYFYVRGMDDDLSTSLKMEYVNQLIQQVYEVVHQYKNVTFGISPAGNLENARAQGADVDIWLSQDGYIDYIMPQIYWSDMYIVNEETIRMFKNRCNEWMNINMLHKPMYIGLALYRVGEKDFVDYGWSEHSRNLADQCAYLYENGCNGFALFRFEWLRKEQSEAELCALKEYIIKYRLQEQSSYTEENYHAWNHSTDEIPKCITENVEKCFPGYGSVSMFMKDYFLIYAIKYTDGTFGSWKKYSMFDNKWMSEYDPEIKIIGIPREDVKKYLIFYWQVL